MRTRLAKGPLVVQPQVAPLPETYLTRDFFVILDRRPAQRDIDRLPPSRAHPTGVFFARAQPPRQIDVDYQAAHPPFAQGHRQRAADNSRSDNKSFLSDGHTCRLSRPLAVAQSAEPDLQLRSRPARSWSSIARRPPREKL